MTDRERIQPEPLEWSPFDWTNAEVEKFTDALVREINFADVPKQPPIEWHTGSWNGPLIDLDPDDPFGDMERIFRRGIHITSITPPEQGWPIAAHCIHCRRTVIILSPYAIKPEKGDYWMLKGTCLDEELNVQHNLYPQFDFPHPEKMGPRPEEWSDEAYKHYWNPLGVPK